MLRRTTLLMSLFAFTASSARAQGGQGTAAPLRNIQVLPKEMTRQQVVALMRNVSGGLGVRCDYCHVSRVVNGREENDYAADEMETKKVAREMFKMVDDINSKYLAAMGRTLSERARVSCATCHHGVAKPRTLTAELAEAYEKKGVDSAVVRYRELRERYLTRGVYDFGDRALASFTDELLRNTASRTHAVTLLKMNIEFNPQSSFAHMQLGQAHLMMADTSNAVVMLETALQLDPNNAQLQRQLNVLKRQ